jgi:hypothetical protein
MLFVKVRGDSRVDEVGPETVVTSFSLLAAASLS